MHASFQEIKFTDEDVVDRCDFIPAGDFNPHNIHPWLFHDHGFTLCVVFASCLQDALDVAADSGMIDRFRVSEDDLMKDYGPDEEGIARLGNASEPFDIESLGVVELPNPKFSFVALFNATQEGKP